MMSDGSEADFDAVAHDLQLIPQTFINPAKTAVTHQQYVANPAGLSLDGAYDAFQAVADFDVIGIFQQLAQIPAQIVGLVNDGLIGLV